ncbi:putative protein-serine/threonine phosphatase [Helianthus debilis subsp. tardiflorus]
MGACCSCQMGTRLRGGLSGDHCIGHNDNKEAEDDGQVIAIGAYGARIRLRGSTKFVSMFSRKGRKGTNQDAMTVWEDFGGNRGVVYCGVFDGHGPSGHKVSRYVRDTLPSKLSWLLRGSHIRGRTCANRVYGFGDEVINVNDSKDPVLYSWKTSIARSFKEMDDRLEAHRSIDSYCSGSTCVSVLKHGENLIIANVGDSRALLCTRHGNQLHPIQLTVDLKPHTQGEYERIKRCGGRVGAMGHEPSIYRVWMPDQDCPGLAMSRAFGDFCLKDYGLISVPNVYYHKLTEQDEFVVLATDGVWDVLKNEEVVKIVWSVNKRSMAARFVVDYAVRAWRQKYPASKIDDCTVVVLFFKKRPCLANSAPEEINLGSNHDLL